ncbi:MAG: hemolysin family protein [gamma proteobacterium symbiont of Taylorina sp.]|nr:hemolysin family protein [gamma proteobacterium symbiont of Taylorina sp.]
MEVSTTLLIIFLCLLLEGFFSGSEMAIVSADQLKLRHRAAKGSRGAKLALKMLENPEWLLSITLIGTNISVVTNTTMAAALMIHLFGENGSWLAVVLIAPLIWVFGEIVPKSIFQQRADVITPYIIFILYYCSILFYPILAVFSFLTRQLAKLSGGNNQNPFTLREEIVTMLQMPAVSAGDIQPVEQNMIRRMFNFSETTVKEIMLPLIDVSAVEKGISCGDAKQISVEKSHIRLPVYDQRIDKIIGVLNTLDLINIDPETPITEFIQPAFYVPALKSIKDLMFELRSAGIVVAIVVDEFGGAEGIVALEDIMEEVVEDLEDEYDSHHEDQDQFIRCMGERDYIVNARIELDVLCEQLDINIPIGKYTTLAGFIVHKTHSIPKEGVEITQNNLLLTVHKSSAQAVLEVKISW